MRTAAKIYTLIFLTVFVLQCSKDDTVGPEGPSDLAAVEIIGPPVAEVNQPDTWQVLLENAGIGTAYRYSVSLLNAAGQELGAVDLESPIPEGDERLVEFVWTPNTIEEIQVYGSVNCETDGNSENDISPSFRVRIHPQGERQYLIWDHDNASGDTLSELGLVRALRGNGVQCFDLTKGNELGLLRTPGIFLTDVKCDVSKTLSKVIRNYEVVFIALGAWST